MNHAGGPGRAGLGASRLSDPTGATCGRSWRVHFAPDAAGTWRWTAFFRSGPGVAIDDGAGVPPPPDGLTGAFEVAPTDKAGRDHLGAWPREYEVLWYETRRGGDLRKGSVERISGPGPKALGAPPSDPERDWAVLVRRVSGVRP